MALNLFQMNGTLYLHELSLIESSSNICLLKNFLTKNFQITLQLKLILGKARNLVQCIERVRRVMKGFKSFTY